MDHRTVDAEFRKYDDRGAYHWEGLKPTVRKRHAFTVERYARTIAAMGPLAGKDVLELGSGDGALLGMLASKADGVRSIAGYDPNPSAQRLAEQELSRAGVEATIHVDVSSIPAEAFDIVVSADVIEHVESVGDHIGLIRRSLRPSGRAVITTPIRLEESPRDPNHRQEWFQHEFTELLEDGGLRVLSNESSIPFAAVSLYGWVPRITVGRPVLRYLVNLISIHRTEFALTALRLPDELHVLQVVVAAVPTDP